MSSEPAYCGHCGQALGATGHDACGERRLDPPRWCDRCGRRLDVQVFPTSVRATCRRCDGVHPARRDAADA